jgi:hypothetical protein
VAEHRVRGHQVLQEEQWVQEQVVLERRVLVTMAVSRNNRDLQMETLALLIMAIPDVEVVQTDLKVVTTV